MRDPTTAEGFMTQLSIGILQCDLSAGGDTNVERVVELIRKATKEGAKIVVPPELFESPYFPQEKSKTHFSLAKTANGHPTITKMQALAAELDVVIPVSFFERDGDRFFNSVATVNADGSVLGVYRKTHIPDEPGYEEQFYFSPGDTGFKVWQTKHGNIGVGICWDQWFPECARAMALQGAEVLLYPTAIGSEPANPDEDTQQPWQKVMTGHAVANAIPLAASNRIGKEDEITFYGSSFVVDQRGDKKAELSRNEEGVAVVHFDRTELARYRSDWDFFKYRQPQHYKTLSET